MTLDEIKRIADDVTHRESCDDVDDYCERCENMLDTATRDLAAWVEAVAPCIERLREVWDETMLGDKAALVATIDALLAAVNGDES